MKYTISRSYRYVIALILATISFEVSAGCLDGLTTTHMVHSKVQGLYIRKAGGVHFVILDKVGCTANSSGDVTISSNTKTHYYLYFDDNEKAILSILLSAQATGNAVSFRLGQNVVEGYNQLLYVITPQKAWEQ